MNFSAPQFSHLQSGDNNICTADLTNASVSFNLCKMGIIIPPVQPSPTLFFLRNLETQPKGSLLTFSADLLALKPFFHFFFLFKLKKKILNLHFHLLLLPWSTSLTLPFLRFLTVSPSLLLLPIVFSFPRNDPLPQSNDPSLLLSGSVLASFGAPQLYASPPPPADLRDLPSILYYSCGSSHAKTITADLQA